jgi:serine/threonine-protein kinase RsbW
VRPVGALLVRHEPASAALVRHELVEDLERQNIAADSIDEVALVASELVGNAVRHAPPSSPDGTIDVRWDVDDSRVTLRVRDPSDVKPKPRQPRVDEAGGRGLTIVAAMAEDWGYRPVDSGKKVWARIPVRTELSAS